MVERVNQKHPLRRAALVALVALLATIALLAGCGVEATKEAGTPPPSAKSPTPLQGLPKNKDGYADLTVHQLEDSLAAKNYTLVNVHVPYEGELPQTDLFIPYDEIEQQVSKLPDKGAAIVLYCRSGQMSTAAAQALVKLGYTNVMELDGGMVAWESSGRELLQKR